ncbi:MAG TPA: SAM-dependent methyltransferase [Streptosporangiaceae bacterium]|nr:SAM-dependent methyltransferase [Streptosporangiaceae bacterium]
MPEPSSQHSPAATAEDWHAWHDGYDVPDSLLARRLAVVQGRIRTALDSRPPGPLKAISICAGQGRDLISVLASHPRGSDVRARLVELDPRNAAVARDAARAAGLDGVEVVVGDAARTDHYAQMVPADLVLACGIFGNITAGDIEKTIGFLGCMTATGGTVLWTRHRREPDLTPLLCRWFAQHGFELAWLSDPGQNYGVGVHTFTAAPTPLPPGATMFNFIGRERARELERRGSTTNLP